MICIYTIISHGTKGGTGKSMVACNIALGLKELGYKVGLIDLDSDSPNLPAMFGLYGGVELDSERYFLPEVVRGMRVMSTGLFTESLHSSFKRGEENRQIIRDMTLYTRWGDTQVLVADAPAGNSDECMAYINAIGTSNVLGVVLVSTPSTLDDVKRSVDVFSRIGIRILGVIENYKGVLTSCGVDAICPHCSEPVRPYVEDDVIKSYTESIGLNYIMSVPIIEGFVNGKGHYPQLPTAIFDKLLLYLVDLKVTQ